MKIELPISLRCRVFALAVLWLLVPAHAEAATGCDDLRGTPITAQVDWTAEVKPLLISRCVGCHNNPGSFDVSDDQFGGTTIDAIFKIVDRYATPGRPLQSRLFIKLNCSSPDGGLRMPLSGDPLSLGEQALIFDWIAQGARGEVPAGTIARDFVFRDDFESLH